MKQAKSMTEAAAAAGADGKELEKGNKHVKRPRRMWWSFRT